MENIKDIKISGQRIFLKKLKLSDATSQYCSWLNDPGVNKFLTTKKATVASLREYIKEKNRKKDCLFFGIFLKNKGKHIGNIKLEPIAFKSKKATLGIMVGDKSHWGKGLGKEAIEILTNWVFDELRLEKIYLGVDKKNTRAVKAYKKAGFSKLKNSTKMLLQKDQASKLILGTAQFGLDYGINNLSGKMPKKEVFRVLKYAWENKIRFLDTASGYGESEKLIGEFTKKYKLNFKIITGEFPRCTAKNLEKYFLSSLKSLNQEEIYGYLIHNFNHYLKDRNIWKILKKLKSEGKISKIGFSLYYPKQLKIILKKNIKPDIVQIPYNFFDQRFAKHFSLLKKNNIQVNARSIFLQGLFFKKPESLENKFIKLKNRLIFLKKISLNKNIPLSALAINFAFLNQNIDKLVVGVDSLSNLQENLRGLKYKNKVKNLYSKLLALKEDEEKLILPLNW